MKNSKKSITQKIVNLFKSWHLSPQGSRPETREFNNTIGDSANGKIKMHWHIGYKLPILFFKPKD